MVSGSEALDAASGDTNLRTVEWNPVVTQKHYIIFQEMQMGDDWEGCAVRVSAKQAWKSLTLAVKSKYSRNCRLIEVGEEVREITAQEQIGGI